MSNIKRSEKSLHPLEEGIQTCKALEQIWGHTNIHVLWVGMENVTISFLNSWDFFQKLNALLSYDLVIPFLVTFLTEVKACALQKDTHSNFSNSFLSIS